MALDTPVRLSFDFEDEWGIKTSAAFYAQADSAIALGTIDHQWTVLHDLLQAVSGAKMAGGSLAIVHGVPGAPAAAAGSRVESCGIFNFSAAGTTKRWGAEVPAILASKLTGDRINLADTDVAALVGALVLVDATFQYANDHEQLLAALLDAFLAIRKKRRQLHRSSLET